MALEPTYDQIVERVRALEAQRLALNAERQPDLYAELCEAEKHVRALLAKAPQHQQKQRGWRALAAAYRMQRAIQSAPMDAS